MSGVLETFLQSRLVKTFLFFLYVVVVITSIWFVNINDPPVNERCSKKYPEFGMTLHNASQLDNGTLMSLDGNTFPPNTYWIQNGVFKGCPCALESCIKKCCPRDQIFDHQGNCTKSNVTYGLSKMFEVYSNNNKSFRGTNNESPGVNFTKRLAVIDTGCPDGRMYTLRTNELYLMDNGRLWHKPYEHFLDQSKYCFEENESFPDKVQYAFCVEVLDDVRLLSLKRKRRAIVMGSIHLVTMIMHGSTILVFAMTPWLKNGYGKSIMSYVSAHFFRSFINILYEIRLIKKSAIFCISMALAWDYLWLSARSWLLIVSFQVWSALRPGPVIKEEQDKRRFFQYSILAWGLPLLQALSILAIDLIELMPEELKPRFGKPTCWFNNKFAVTVDFIIPSVLAELIILAMFMASIYRLRAYRSRSLLVHTRRRCSDQGQGMKQYLRLVMLLGVNYMLADLVLYYDWYYGTSRAVWQSAMAISGLRGSEVFFMFALNRNNIQLTVQKPSTLPRFTTTSF